MRFLDKSYFIGERFIPNLNERCESDIYFLAQISGWEDLSLRHTLGDCLFDELIDNLEFDTETNRYKLIDTADQKWEWLLYGHSYTKEEVQNSNGYNHGNCHCKCKCRLECNTFNFNGIFQETNVNNPIDGKELTIRKSYVADYVYHHWMQVHNTTTTGVGEVSADTSGGTRVNNAHKKILAWNDFVYKVIKCSSQGGVSLYQFINDFSDLFPEWNGKCNWKLKSTW